MNFEDFEFFCTLFKYFWNQVAYLAPWELNLYTYMLIFDHNMRKEWRYEVKYLLEKSFPYSHGSKGTGRENAWELQHPIDPFLVSFISHVSFPFLLSSLYMCQNLSTPPYLLISCFFYLLFNNLSRLRQFARAVINNANLRILDVRIESQFCVSWPESKMGTLTEGSDQNSSVRVEKVVKDFWSEC